MRNKLSVIAIFGLLAAPMSSSSAIISGTYSFSATEFIQSGAPVNPFTGSFSISFDNAANIDDATAGFTLISIPAGFSGVSGFDYRVFDDSLIIGGLISSVGLVDSAAFDWGLVISSISTAPRFESLMYSRGVIREFFTSRTGEVSVASVPEPGTLALLGLGFAGLGIARRKRAA